MPTQDCGNCEILTECSETIITDEKFYTLVSRLLCEWVDLTAAAVAAMTAYLGQISDSETDSETEPDGVIKTPGGDFIVTPEGDNIEYI